VTAITPDIVAPSPLVAGLLVRLEADGVDAGGRVVSVGDNITVAMLSGMEDFLTLGEGSPVSIQFGVGGMLFIGESSIESWEGLTNLVLPHPLFEVHQRRKYPRFSIRVPMTAVVGEQGSLSVRGDSIDMSAGGTACILPGVVLATDAVVTVTMLLPDGHLTTDAVVLEGGRVHRLRFEGISNEDVDRLVSFCQRTQMDQDED
jgi:c-di-GMP-binding flagellar brake protein YcgR